MKHVHVAAQYFLNHHLRADEVREHIREFAAAGYACIYPHARAGLTTPYLSEKWFEIIDVISDECRKRGMEVAIWDEDYYPSPDAGNRVVWDHPELRGQHLAFTTVRAPGGCEAAVVLEPAATVLRCFAVADGGAIIDITASAGSIRRNWSPRRYQASGYSNCRKIEAPHRRTGLSERRFSVLWDAPAGQDYTVVAVQVVRASDGGHNCDILNPAAIDAFLGYTHEAYLQRYGDTFSSRFSAAFMDEPAPACDFPWTSAFPDEFRQEHGYDLLPLLAHLSLDIDEQTPLIRHHYRLTQMRLQCTNYLEKIASWCHAHALLSIGHLTRTEWLSLDARWWPNELRCCKYLDLPCTDPLGFHVALPDASAYHTGIKVVASAARLFGKAQAGSDALAVMGNEVSLRDLAYQLDYQMVLGITFFNIHGLSYSLDGPRKDEVPPSIFYQHSQWPIMGELLRPLTEKCRRLSDGRPVRRLLVLYPSTTIYCGFNAQNMDFARDHAIETQTHDLSEMLLSRHQDFDFIDEITLAEKPVAELRRDYAAILLNQSEWMAAPAADAIERFADAGGRVVVCGDHAPRLLDNPVTPQRRWLRGETCLTPTLPADLPGLSLAGEGAEHVFVQERITSAGTRLFFLFNRADRSFDGLLEGQPVRVPPRGSCFADLRQPPAAVHRDGQHLSRFSLTFPSNALPLPCWKVRIGDVPQPDADFMVRSLPVVTGEATYETPFLLQGHPSTMRLVVEESSFAGAWHCFVNGHAVDGFQADPLFDCRNRSADITPYLVADAVPRKNVIRFVCAGGMLEMPYLVGPFSAAFRHGHRYLPNLVAATGPIPLDSLCGWHELGYSSFSGCAIYRTAFTLDRTGDHILDCGRVEDAVECYLDGVRIGCRIQPPYGFELAAVAAGVHQLELRVWNGPGNRERLSGISAGLLGPVRVSPA